MTNEEKAKEIGAKYIYANQIPHYEFGEIHYEIEEFGEEAEDAALDMAKWKDEQVKNYLLVKLNDLEKAVRLDAAKAMKEVIKELFHEE